MTKQNALPKETEQDGILKKCLKEKKFVSP